jgi:hypothetical protein
MHSHLTQYHRIEPGPAAATRLLTTRGGPAAGRPPASPSAGSCGATAGMTAGTLPIPPGSGPGIAERGPTWSG